MNGQVICILYDKTMDHDTFWLSLFLQILQLIMKKMNYLGLENLIEWVTYVASILLVLDWNQCQMDNPGVREVKHIIIGFWWGGLAFNSFIK